MNVKKMFASLTGVLMLASAVTPMVTGAANYSDELKGAYEYAYSKNITTMSSIDGANMYGELTRGQLAKMIANWAEKENGTKVDETAVCSFADANTAEGDLAAYVKKACQMGLMGQGVDNFRPNDKVTRGEFGTTLSRALWGDKYNGGTPFYKNHLEALKEAKIMMKIDTPNQMEIRGFVMLMLQRSAEVVTPAECKDAAVILACALNGENCPAACKKPVNPETTTNTGDNVAGDLSVNVAKVANVVSVPAKGIVTFGTVNFKASESVTVKGASFERIGLGNFSDVKGIWFEKDGVRVSNKAYVSNDNTASLSFNPALVVKADETLDLVAELSGSMGAEHALKITKLDTTAKNVTMVNAETSTFRTTTYEVATLNFHKVAANVTYKLGSAEKFELGKFKIDNYSSNSKVADKTVLVKSLVLRNTKSADLSNLKDIVVYKNGKQLSEKATTDGKYLTVVLNDEIKAGQSATYTILGKVIAVDSTEGDFYQFEVKKAEDINAIELGTKFRTAVTLNDSVLGSYKVEGGNILFKRDTALSANVNAPAGQTDIVVLKGTVTPKDPVVLEDLELAAELYSKENFGNAAATYDPKKGFDKNDISRVVLKIGNTSVVGQFEGETFDYAGQKKVEYTLKFPGTFYLNGESNVSIEVNLKGTAPEQARFKFVDSLKISKFKRGEYQGSQNNLPDTDADGFIDATAGVGQIVASELKVQAATLNVVKTSNTSEVTIVKDSSNEVVLYEGNISTAADDGVTLDSATVSIPANVQDLHNGQASATLYIGDSIFGPYNTDAAGDVKFQGMGLRLEKNQAKKLKVAININGVDAADVGVKFSPTLTIEATNAQGNKLADKSVSTAKFKIVNAGSVSPTSNTSIKASFLNENTAGQDVAKFNLTLKNEDLNLKDIVLTVADAANVINALSVGYLSGNSFVKVGDLEETTANTTWELRDITNVKLAPGAYTFVLKSDFGTYELANANNTPGNVGVTFTNVVLNFEGVNGAVSFGPGNNNTVALGLNHQLAKVAPVIAKPDNFKPDTTSLLKVTLTNSSTEHALKVKSFKFTTAGFGAGGNAAITKALKVIVDNVTYTTENSAAGVFAMQANEEVVVPAGSTKEVTFQIQDPVDAIANDKTATIELDQVAYLVEEDTKTYNFTVDETNATNLANWAGLYSQIKG